MRSTYLAAFLPALLAAPAWANQLPAPQTETILLDFQDSVTQAEIAAFEAQYGVSTRLNSVHSDAEELRLTQPMSAAEQARLLAAMQGDPRLEHAEPLATYTLPDQVAPEIPQSLSAPDKFPNDPLYKHQWHLDQINMPQAWNDNSGKGVIVAVIDTGVAYETYYDAKRQIQFKQVPDLAQTCIAKDNYDFVNDTEHANDDHAHGTHVAGTIAQSTNNGVGVAGVAYKSCIMAIKVLSAQGGGTTGDIADGIRFAADRGAKVINMSLGGPFPSGVMKDAVDYARKKGVTIIAAAGNNGWRKVGYPAAYEGVVAVSATDIEDNLTFYSNYGDDIDIAGPGGDTRSDKNKDGVPDGVVQNTIAVGDPSQSKYLPFMGTSMASPHVAGVAALVVATGVTKPDDVEKVLYKTAHCPTECKEKKNGEKWGEKYGHGRVDAAAAVKAAQQMVAASAEEPPCQASCEPSAFSSGLSSVLRFVFLFSALVPLLLIGLFGHTKLRGLFSVISLASAASLAYAAFAGALNLAFLPGTLIESAWLLLNAVAAAFLGYFSRSSK